VKEEKSRHLSLLGREEKGKHLNQYEKLILSYDYLILQNRIDLRGYRMSLIICTADMFVVFFSLRYAKL